MSQLLTIEGLTSSIHSGLWPNAFRDKINQFRSNVQKKSPEWGSWLLVRNDIDFSKLATMAGMSFAVKRLDC